MAFDPPLSIADREFQKFVKTLADAVAVRIQGDVSLASGAETTVVETGAQRVNDSINGLLLKEILTELKFMNAHLGFVTDEPLTHEDLKDANT
jgi:hypothetical protein